MMKIIIIGGVIMNKQKALLIKNSLGARSKRNLVRYCKQLHADYDEAIFDDRALEVMLRYAKDKQLIEDVRQWCNNTDYSQSKKIYSQLKIQLERFAQDDYTSFRWNRNYQEAKALLISIFSKANLKPLYYSNDQDIKDALPKKDTHSGWTYILTDKKRKGDNLEDIYEAFMRTVNEAKSEGSFSRPILIGVRTQCGNVFNEDGSKIYDEHNQPIKATHKTRLVSMIDLHQIIAELIWAKPLQKLLGDQTLWYAGGKNDRDLLNRIIHLRGKYRNWISLDYSKYDQSISSWLIKDAFEILSYAFSDIGDTKLWEIIQYDFINKVFIDGEGKIWESHKGVPSGSMFTQIIDSVVNQLMVTTFMIAKGKGSRSFDTLIMGDDNLIFVNGVEKSEICTYLQKNFGIETNSEKSSAGFSSTNAPEFLSRFWTIYGPYRQPNILICKLLFPERFRQYDLKKFSPEIVFYSYILAYEKGMREAFNVDEFLIDNQLKLTDDMLVKGQEHLPGYIGYARSYGLM